MPKQKTSRCAHKRFKRTSSGKFRRSRAYKNHKLTHKRPKRKRRLRQSTLVSRADERRMRRLIQF